MGTIPMDEEQAVVLPDGRVASISSFTTTGDLSVGGEGTAWVEGRISDGRSFSLHVPLSDWSDAWMRRLANALAHDAAFADRLVDDPAELDGIRIPAAPDRDGGAVGRLRKKGGKAKFKDYATLKSGRDEFSSMKLEVLEEAIDGPDFEKIVGRLSPLGPERCAVETAKTIRWMLRGLPVDMALRKTEVDREVTANAAGAKRRR